MKKAILILLLLVLPWQAIASTERHLAHIFGSRGDSSAIVTKHLAQHVANILHHHDEGNGDDDDGDDDNDHVTADDGTHQDNSQKSVQHLADYEHNCSFNILFAAQVQLRTTALPRSAPAHIVGTFTDRTTTPLLRPPRVSA